jgi:hypothetical protein
MKFPPQRNAAIGVAFLALATLVLWQHLQGKRWIAETASLRDQLEQVATLREENERLAQQLRTTAERSQTNLGELLRLRGQVGRTRQMERENAQLRMERDRLAKGAQSSAAATEEPAAPQTPEEKIQRAKGIFGRDMGLALIRAAEANGGIVPTDLRGPLFETVETLSGGAVEGLRASHFEVVYIGSMREMKDGMDTVLAREKEPVQLQDGKWLRLYLMADGSSRYIAAEAHDDFAAREKELWSKQFQH